MAKAAIIGCGMIAGRFEDFSSARIYSHAKAYANNPAFEALALHDRTRAHADALAAKAHAVVYDTIDDLLARFAPDVVSVCTPDGHHAAALSALLTHPKAPALVLCEKPVCGTRAEFENIHALERKGRSRVIVNHSRRFDPAHQKLKQRIVEGEFGDLVQAHINYYGGWRHLGVHVVDILQYFFETRIDVHEATFCCASRYSDDPTLDVVGALGGGLLRMTGFPERLFQIVELSLLMERGQLRISDFGQSIDVFRKTVNAEGENVLARDEAASGSGMAAPMVNVIAVAASYLETRDPAPLEPFGLEQAAITMETLWQGDQLFAAQA